MFGLIKRSRVGVLIDVSDANCGFGRLTHFQEALMVGGKTRLLQSHRLQVVYILCRFCMSLTASSVNITALICVIHASVHTCMHGYTFTCMDSHIPIVIHKS